MGEFSKRKCAFCGKEFLARNRELKIGRARCCSRSCATSLRNQGELNPNWRGGISKNYFIIIKSYKPNDIQKESRQGKQLHVQ